MHSNFNDLKNKNMNLELERFLESQTEMLGNLTITDSINVETLTDICEEYHKRKLKLLGIGVVVGQSEQLVCGCGRDEINKLSGICEICWSEKFPDESN